MFMKFSLSLFVSGVRGSEMRYGVRGDDGRRLRGRP